MIRRETTQSSANRRVSHKGQRLLDVKIRKATARRDRRQRVGGFFWKLALFVVCLAAAGLGISTALDKFFFSNSEYTLRQIHLALDGVMTPEDALAVTGLREGVNIFRVNLSEVEASLKTIPQVAAVQIERRLPDQISLTLKSKQPVAWIAPADDTEDPFDPANALLVDAKGFFIIPRLIQPEFYQLPIIYGVKSPNILDSEPLHREDLMRGLRLLEIARRTPASALRIRTVNIGKGYCIDVTNDRNAKITFAAEDFEEQLERLARLLEHCSESGRELATVNLMVKRNTPVTFVPSAPLREKSPSITAKNQPSGGRAN